MSSAACDKLLLCGPDLSRQAESTADFVRTYQQGEYTPEQQGKIDKLIAESAAKMDAANAELAGLKADMMAAAFG